MKKICLLIVFILIFSGIKVTADQFVPEFDKMKFVRCEIDEEIFNQDNTKVSSSHYHRFYRWDDEYKQVFIQKEPVDRLIYYGPDRIEFRYQDMTDDFIEQTKVVIDRSSMKYSSASRINYDNPDFGSRYSKGEGDCKILE